MQRAAEAVAPLDAMTIMTNITIDDGVMVMNDEVPSDTWTVAQAKAKLREVIDKARRKGPQAITRKGKRAVVVVDAEIWAKPQRRSEDKTSELHAKITKSYALFPPNKKHQPN